MWEKARRKEKNEDGVCWFDVVEKKQGSPDMESLVLSFISAKAD